MKTHPDCYPCLLRQALDATRPAGASEPAQEAVLGRVRSLLEPTGPLRTPELVIAKGQANYETPSDEGPKVFFALQVKCPVIAHDVGVPVGSIVLEQGVDGSHLGNTGD